MNRGLNILIIEPSQLLSIGLKQTLSDEGLIRYCKSYSDIKEYKANEDFEKNIELWDIVLLNPHTLNELPHPMHILHSLFQGSTLIGVLTNFYDRKYQNIFNDYIYLHDNVESVVECISKYRPGETNHIADEKVLTKREMEVLKCLIKGDSIKEISNKLNISNHTALTHRRNISHKIGVKSVAAMAIYAVATNIIDPKDSLPDLR